MKQLLCILLFTPTVILAQNRKEKLFISNNLKIKKLSKSPNYIEEPVRLSLTEYLKTKNLDPDNYFVDSITRRNKDTLVVNIWDVVGLETLRKSQMKTDSLSKTNSKMKYPKPIGNPGNCFTAYYSLSKNEIIAIDIWQ